MGSVRVFNSTLLTRRSRGESPSGMKTPTLLHVTSSPRFTWWRALPIFGPLLDDFVQWLRNQGYAVGTIGNYLKTLPPIVRWFRRHQMTTLDRLTQAKLNAG